MNPDIIINPKSSGDPQILFVASGVNDTPLRLKVLSKFDTVTGSGSALVFEGTEGHLFSVTDNRSSGTIFNLTDKQGLSIFSTNASGDVKIGEFSDRVSIGYIGLEWNPIISDWQPRSAEYPFDVFCSGNFRDNVIFNSGVALNTVTSGLWQGSIIGVERGGTGQSSYADGQILIGSGNTLVTNTLSPGNGISINNEAGNITISAITTASTPDFYSYGRLTLTSNDPIGNDVVDTNTIYFTPYLGNTISLFYNNEWKTYTFSQLSLVLTGTSAGRTYDIFLSDTGGGNLILEKVVWQVGTNARATPIVYKDGILVHSVYTEKRYLGTFVTNGANATSDTTYRRLLFNANNQIRKRIIASAPSNPYEHTYSSSTIRLYRNISDLGITQAQFANGLPNSLLDITCSSLFTTETGSSSVGIAIDTMSSINTQAFNTTSISSGPALIMQNTATDNINPSIGFHILYLLQSGSSNSTFTNASMKGTILC